MGTPWTLSPKSQYSDPVWNITTGALGAMDLRIGIAFKERMETGKMLLHSIKICEDSPFESTKSNSTPSCCLK